MKHVCPKSVSTLLIFILACGLLLSACASSSPETEVPPLPTDTPEVIDTPVPTDTPLPTATFTPEAVSTQASPPTAIAPSTFVRECNSLGAYSLEIPKTNYVFKEDNEFSYIHRVGDYVLMTLVRGSKETPTSLTELLEEHLVPIKTDVEGYEQGEIFETAFPAGDALAVAFSGKLLDEPINGQVTVIAAQDDTFLVVVAVGRYDGPNSMWVEEGEQVTNHVLESIEIYPLDQDIEVCPVSDVSDPGYMDT